MLELGLELEGQDGQENTFDRTDHRQAPRSGSGTFAGSCATVVTVSPDYALRLGPLVAPLDLLYVRRNYVRGMKNLLAGLKGCIERGSD